MTFLYILSWVSLVLQVCFVTISIAAGLYYLAELVEEYITVARRAILLMIISTTIVYIMFIFFDDLPWKMVLCGFAAQVFHFSIMRNFPTIRFLSVPFIGAVIFLIINHLLAFQYFTSYYFPFTQVLAYFTICLWIVPFALFVSLNANDNVLPTVNENSYLRGDQDVVTHYFARGKKQGLLSLFNYVKDSIFPSRNKKSF
ncbi:protein TEX261-like [Teleopsis dalmanni]|uniref:protein TEX261-like n=1 Tax=Teleopsis dalmanni TaxID=139649 RepID=UPI0018CE203C|nr:protein TEX261-like [Teleopsis dalmanni]XP_037947095.1 protein TEX261-like [Teleopsis dalmanni]